MGARCQVCSAPVVQKDGVCAFCRSPVSGLAEPQELVAYLADRLPGAQVKHTFAGRGAVREVAFRGRLGSFRARVRRGRLQVEPDVSLPEWLEMLMAELTRMAASDGQVRRKVSRSGWAFR